MGVDVHVLNFLRYAKSKKQFGDTITIGRQALFIGERIIKRLVSTGPDYRNNPYCENLLIEYFGAQRVDSIDHSAYEGATYTHDMNQPLPSALVGKFDTVFDGGCIEHVFNAPQALNNCSQLCKPGAQLIHVLPANNFCGHGFWQFSPELFFSLYSAQNGYADVEIFLADLTDTKVWYQVKQPTHGVRVEVVNSNPLYILVRALVVGPEFKQVNVQQSDYVFEWMRADNKGAVPAPRNPFRQKLKCIPLVYAALAPTYHWFLNRRRRISNGLNSRNPGLRLIKLKDLLN